MSREWKPGDVAMVDGHVSVRSDSGAWYRSARQNVLMVDGELPEVRPLVVIDPEDREQVGRLRDTLHPHLILASNLLSKWQDGLREFADPTPPKPEEPTGLGAVVEDAFGGKWVRLVCNDSTPDDWKRAGYAGIEDRKWYRYSDIDVVRVLSEGVTP